MKNNVPKIIFLVLFFLFIALYLIGNSSYYDYEASRKNRLTEEQIKYFESEIDSGNEIDIDGYLAYEEKNYDNLISNTTKNISNTISKSFSKALNFILSRMSNVLENK